MRTLFFAIYMENSPGTFSKKAIHQEKLIVMGISAEANPLAKLVIAPSFFTLGPKCILTQLNTNFKQIAILLYPHLYGSLFFNFVLNRENNHLTYTCPVFLSELDHNNGTVKHILSHLDARYEQYKDCFINHRHRVYYCCINC